MKVHKITILQEAYKNPVEILNLRSSAAIKRNPGAHNRDYHDDTD